MSWLLRHNWLWALLAFLLGAVITWLLLVRRESAARTSAGATNTTDSTDSTGSSANRTDESAVLIGAAAVADEDHETAVTTQGASEPLGEPAASGSAGTPLGRSPGPEGDPAERQQAEPTGTKVTPPAEAAPAAEVSPTPAPVTSADPQPAPQGRVAPASAADTVVEPAAKVEKTPADRVEAPTLFDVPDEDEPAVRAGDVPAEGRAAQDDVPAGTGGDGVAAAEVPPGRFGAGSADALPDGTAPAGFTIKGNAQSMLFHTTESPYYGRTKAKVFFRTEEDATRAGFTKYVRKRKQK